jgi:hypothetical protein
MLEMKPLISWQTRYWMNKLKQWVRIWWLWLKKEFVIANSHCVRCGKRGASACSLANLAKLCDRCATAVCREYDTGEHEKDTL